VRLISVTVELGGPYREEHGQWHMIRLPEGSTVRDALRRVGVEEELYIVVVRNSRQSSLGEALRDGDNLVAYPPVGGG
jgi:molybdopterin converting factor small subunit